MTFDKAKQILMQKLPTYDKDTQDAVVCVINTLYEQKEAMLGNAGLRQLVRSLRYEQGRMAAAQFTLLKGFAATRGSLDEFWKQWNNETEEMISQAQSTLQD